MTFGFQRRIKLAPGLHLNLSKWGLLVLLIVILVLIAAVAVAVGRRSDSPRHMLQRTSADGLRQSTPAVDVKISIGAS